MAEMVVAENLLRGTTAQTERVRFGFHAVNRRADRLLVTTSAVTLQTFTISIRGGAA